MLQDNLPLAVVKERSPNRMSVQGARLVSLLLFFSQSKTNCLPELETGKQIHARFKGDQDSTFSANLSTWTHVYLKNEQRKKSLQTSPVNLGKSGLNCTVHHSALKFSLLLLQVVVWFLIIITAVLEKSAWNVIWSCTGLMSYSSEATHEPNHNFPIALLLLGAWHLPLEKKGGGIATSTIRTNHTDGCLPSP